MKPDISLATKTGHFNLLRTCVFPQQLLCPGHHAEKGGFQRV
jgi:hypothetical protein